MIGKEILNYKIISLIGKGGMGSVYLAQNKYIQQQKVAIKIINSNMINDFSRQTFAKEADKLARLNHPNIVHFINYHVDEEGSIYLIMEYADGYSLEEYIKNVSGLIVEDKICSFFEPLLDAFDYAHKNNIIHKDIKPANIIITKDGTPKILDFGISELLSEKGSDADQDVIMGTPSYMSPEQVKGLPLDQRSDIYSLGVLLHQMLTGNPPYDTTTLTEHEIYKHVVDDELPRMKTYYKYVSDKVQAIVDKATSKKPEARYASCSEFKKALHNAIYPPVVSKWGKLGIATAAAVIVGAGIFVWDYNRVKVFYYKDYAEKWSIPQGIGKISNSDKSHVHRMYKFESRHYKLQRVSHVNSIGTIIPDGESERYDRPLDMLFYYNDDNRLSRVKVKDHNGQVLYIKSYNEKLNTVVFQFDDEYGTEKNIGSQTVGYIHAFDENQYKSKISRYLLEYDKNGYVTTLRYAGFQNILVGDADGIYGKQYVRDSKGRVIEESYLAYDGSPKATKWGMGKKLFSYDEEDNWISSRYLTIDGEPSLDDSDGTGLCENEYDKYGNEIAQYFKTSDGQLMIPGKYGVSGVKTEYDDNGYIRKQSFLGIDGNVEFSAKQGFAISVTECDENGFFNKMEYQDATGVACLTDNGNSYVRMVNDPHGNELERWLYDLNGDLVLNPEGYAGVKSEYDTLGHAVKIVFYGIDGEPCELNSGVAGWQREYDKMGNVIKESNLDVQLFPTRDNNNVCTYIFERDLRGNITKKEYLDETGQPGLNSEGIAGIVLTYNDGGNETERRFYDTKGKLTKGYLGYARRVHTFDDMGHMLSYRYYDDNNKLVLVDGIAGTDYKVDSHGNIIEDLPVGVDQKLASGKLISRYKYDNKDNLIEYALFNAYDQPATNSMNYHKYSQKFNSRNQCVEICYYNTIGELTNYNNANYCIQRTEYNEKGQQVKVSYFDKDNKPAAYSGSDGNYSCISSEYDNYGRVVRQYFYDKNGSPTDPNAMVPEGAVQYDRRGNIIYLASFDGKGKLIMNPKTGWSFMKMEYDNKDNMLWSAYFDEKERPMRCKEGYHKIVKSYTVANKQESESYYDTDGKPMLINGYHKEVYKYNDNQQCVELLYLGIRGNQANCSYGYSRIVFTYNSDQSPRDKKYYSSAGKMLLQTQYINGEWVAVKNWQKDVSDFADNLPLELGEDAENLVIQSAKIVNSSLVEIVMASPKSKYDMTNSSIDKYSEVLELFTQYLKEQLEIPRGVVVKGILKDGKGRVLSTTKK